MDINPIPLKGGEGEGRREKGEGVKGKGKVREEGG